MNDLFSDADVISTYTRAQAIADGVLIDLGQPELAKLVREAGFRVPVAMTVAAWHEAVVPSSGQLPECQSIEGRLWDVLWLLSARSKLEKKPTDRIHYQVRVWTGRRHKIVRLWALCGPGDQGEPVITIMLEGED